MSRVKIENDQLIITVQGMRKLFSLKSEVAIHLDNITSVQGGLQWKELPQILKSVRAGGTRISSFYFGGTFFQEGNKAFYDVKNQEDAVVIGIKDEDFDTVIIGVDNCEAAVKLIQQALDNR